MKQITTIILNGGAATRMRPLSQNKLKSMITFMGKPLLFYLLRDLKKNDFRKIILTSQGRNKEVSEYFSDGKKLGISIKYITDTKWMGTAGTIWEILKFYGNEISDPFMVVYGDSLLKADYSKMLDFHKTKQSKCTILYHRPDFNSFLYEYHDAVFTNRGKRTNFGILNINNNEEITKVEEKPIISTIKKNFMNPVANATVYILEKETFKRINEHIKSDFPSDFFPKLVKEKVPCFGFNVGNGYRLDIGTVGLYFSTQMAILDKKIRFDTELPEIEHSIWIDKSTKIKSKKNLKKPSYIGKKCLIDSGTIIEHSIIGDNVCIGKNSRIINSIILDSVNIGNYTNISNSIIGEHSILGDRTLIPHNSIIGQFCNFGKMSLNISDPKLTYLLWGRK